MATRTTHPLALRKLNDLLELLGPGQLSIENRYEWLTKTDVVRRIEQHGGTGQIARAVSCTSVREQDTLRTHCGACSQCLDRRFAILAAGLEKHDPPECYATDVLFGPRERERSITMALEWTRHALRLRQLDERGFMSAFGHELMWIIRGHDTISKAEALRRILDLHVRHSKAVAGVLEQVVAQRASDIVAGKLPSSSLVGMFLGHQEERDHSLPLDPRTNAEIAGPLGNVTEVDFVPDRDEPLVVAFFDEGNDPVVAIEGLGRINGAPAKVAHALKPGFDDARASGLAHDDYPFVQLATLHSLNDMSKDAIRQNVLRCRKSLHEFFHDVYGIAPDRPLLIEGKSPKGHRLEPSMRLKAKDRIGAH